MFWKSVPLTKAHREGGTGVLPQTNSLGHKTLSQLKNIIEKCGKHQFHGFILLFVNIFELRRWDCSLLIIQYLLELGSVHCCGLNTFINNTLTWDKGGENWISFCQPTSYPRCGEGRLYHAWPCLTRGNGVHLLFRGEIPEVVIRCKLQKEGLWWCVYGNKNIVSSCLMEGLWSARHLSENIQLREGERVIDDRHRPLWDAETKGLVFPHHSGWTSHCWLCSNLVHIIPDKSHL